MIQPEVSRLRLQENASVRPARSIHSRMIVKVGPAELLRPVQSCRSMQLELVEFSEQAMFSVHFNCFVF